MLRLLLAKMCRALAWQGLNWSDGLVRLAERLEGVRDDATDHKGIGA